MIYIDTSVVLSEVFSEARHPPDVFWRKILVSSKLLEYELFNRVHARGSSADEIASAGKLRDRIRLVDLSPEALARALDPFPLHVRTLDSLHLATMVFLRGRGQTVSFASYDRRFVETAVAMGFEIEVMDE